MGGLDSFGGGLDELSHVIWVRDHRHVAGLNGINVGREVAQPGEIIRQRGLRELGRGDGVAAGLQALDDGAPARAVRVTVVSLTRARPLPPLVPRLPCLPPGRAGMGSRVRAAPRRARRADRDRW
jgi:hypothetical protein